MVIDQPRSRQRFEAKPRLDEATLAKRVLQLLKWLSVVAEYTHDCLALKGDRGITSEERLRDEFLAMEPFEGVRDAQLSTRPRRRLQPLTLTQSLTLFLNPHILWYRKPNPVKSNPVTAARLPHWSFASDYLTAIT